MGSLKCEENSACPNYQSAICLHCNHRLCLPHITEHHQSVLHNVQNLINESETVSHQINDEYEKSREIYHNILTSAGHWRAKQLEKIEQIYENHLQCVESQQEALNIAHQELSDLLDRDVRQPLKLIVTQRNGSIEVLDHIQQTIKKVQTNSVQLKWNFAALAAASAQHHAAKTASGSDSTAVSLPSGQSPIDSTNLSFKLVSLRDINLRKYRPFKRLVEMFDNLSNIDQTKTDLAAYLKKYRSSLPLPVLVSSYIAAWHRKTDAHEKNIILKEHISTIMKHIPNHVDDYTALIGIHAFFYNERTEGNKREMMTFLLQHFVGHKCVHRNQILNWFNNKDIKAYKGFDGAKQMTAPFIKFNGIHHMNASVQTTSTNLAVDEVEEKPKI